MTAEEFVNNKLGDKNYTHSQYPIYRDEIAQWLNEFLALKQGQNLPISNVVCSASAKPQYCNDCKNYPPNTQGKHKKCKECYFIGNQQSNFETE